MKYLAPEDIYITTEGTVKIGGLQGAVMSCLGPENGGSNSINIDDNLTNKKKKGSGKGINNNYEDIWTGIIPSEYAHLTAPEVLLGGEATSSSSIYCLGTIITYLITGKPLIKYAEKRNSLKQVDYLYRILGTPKSNHYHDFDTLLLSGIFGGQIKKEDGLGVEGHSRVYNMIKNTLSKEWLSLYSGFPILATTTNTVTPILTEQQQQYKNKEKEREKEKEKEKHKKEKKSHHHHHHHHHSSSGGSEMESDGQGIIDFLVACLQLNPKRRKTIEQLFSLNLFQFKTQSLQQYLDSNRIVLERKDYDSFSASFSSSSLANSGQTIGLSVLSLQVS